MLKFYLSQHENGKLLIVDHQTHKVLEYGSKTDVELIPQIKNPRRIACCDSKMFVATWDPNTLKMNEKS